MKTLTSVLLIIILNIAGDTAFAGTGLRTEKKTAREENSIKGNVKSVTLLTYEATTVSGSGQKSILKSKQTTIYDQAGNCIEYNFNNPATKYAGRETYQYNNRNQETEYKDYDSDGSVKNMKTHKYDDKGNMIEEASLKAIGVYRWKATKTYDSKDNLTESIINTFGDNTNTSTRTNYKYDSNNNLTVEDHFDYKGNQDMKYAYKYDSKNRLLEKATFFIVEEDRGEEYEEEQYKDIYKYDAQGNVIEKTEGRPLTLGDIKHSYSFDTNGNEIEDIQTGPKKSRTTRKYDLEGNTIESATYDANNLLAEKNIYTVNDKKENTSYTVLNGDGSIKYKFVYKYEGEDQSGNWLKKTSEKNDVAVFFFEREIVHY